jgi:peptide/nickel transport system permease protein
MRLPKALQNTSLVVGLVISLAIILCAIFAPMWRPTA